MLASQVIKTLQKISDKKLAKNLSWFFKTGKGQYGEGDKFLGIYVPNQRHVAKQFSTLPQIEIRKLLHSPWHEARLTGWLILVKQFQTAQTNKEKEQIFKFYLQNIHRANNWDLVDLTAPYIVGERLLANPKNILYKLARSNNLWERRVAIVSTFAFIKKNQLSDSFKLARILLKDKEDLMHKAVGWMLREAGKRDLSALKKFLNRFGAKLPRTTLRYAIEKLPKDEQKHYLIITKIPAVKPGRNIRRGCDNLS